MDRTVELVLGRPGKTRVIVGGVDIANVTQALTLRATAYAPAVLQLELLAESIRVSGLAGVIPDRPLYRRPPPFYIPRSRRRPPCQHPDASPTDEFAHYGSCPDCGYEVHNGALEEGGSRRAEADWDCSDCFPSVSPLS